jgi:hypothetical protein
MPLYLDAHTIAAGGSADDVAKAHMARGLPDARRFLTPARRSRATTTTSFTIAGGLSAAGKPRSPGGHDGHRHFTVPELAPARRGEG